MNELAVIIGNCKSNKTYEIINNTNENDKHTGFLNNYQLGINKENKFLPPIYWLSKLHKNKKSTAFNSST